MVVMTKTVRDIHLVDNMLTVLGVKAADPLGLNLHHREEAMTVCRPIGDRCDGTPTLIVLKHILPTDIHHLYLMSSPNADASRTSRCSSSPAAPLSQLGRLIPRMWGPFIDMSVVVTVGMAWYGGPPTHWASVVESSLSPSRLEQLRKEKHYVKIFGWLQERVPFLKEIFPMMVGRAHDTFILGAFLETHSNAARATDLHSLRDDLPDYVLPAATASSPLEMIAPPNDHQRKNKHYYGFHSLWTGRLLTPRINRDEFDEDPQAQVFCDAVLDDTIDIDDSNYPSFLYSDDEEFDPEAIDVGLCVGGLLVKAYRRVFTSASSVNKPPGKRGLGRGCISQIYKLDTVAPGSIAYIATLVRNVLSSCDSWEVNDGHFDGEKFYDRVVALFDTEAEDADLGWISDTIVFWNSQVYGHTKFPPGTGTIKRTVAIPQAVLLARQRAAPAVSRRLTAPSAPAAIVTPSSEDLPENERRAPEVGSATQSTSSTPASTPLTDASSTVPSEIL
ncbi:hypothetical protein FKP32DRAFT_1681519 [Trametes sanguinea]|nr:hypothetical protein FKP32DRAFT_1681519 [Trametes sanguinea]